MADNPLIDWSTTDGDNADIDGNDIAESCDPAGINNALRAMVGALARALHALTGEKVTAGTANAQTLTTGLGYTAAAEVMVAFTAGAGLANTGACTLAVDSIGVKNVRLQDGSALYAGAIVAGGIYLVSYDSTAGYWILLNPNAAAAWHAVFRGTVLDGTTTLVQKAERAGKITNVAAQAGAGSATSLTVKINGVALGGTANAISTSESDENHSSSNSYAAGDTISVTIAGASALSNLAVSIRRQE